MLLQNARVGEGGTPTEPDDLQLVRFAQAGDREAFSQLVRRHHAELCRLLWRFARNSHDLDDLVQEVFIKAYTHLPEWEPRQPFLHWLRRIAVNAGRDYCRREGSRRRWQAVESEEATHDSLIQQVPDTAPDPAARVAGDEVKALLVLLPPDDRVLLTLYYLEGWELKVIAAQLGWTLAGVKLRAFRARHRLKKLLSERDPL